MAKKTLIKDKSPEELTKLLKEKRVFLALGSIAFDALWKWMQEAKYPLPAKKPKFSHGLEFKVGQYTVLASYHPSQQNTQTGRFTAAMGDAVRLVAGGRALAYALGLGVLCLAAEIFIPYHRYAGYLKLLTFVLLVYVAVAFTVEVPWRTVLDNTAEIASASGGTDVDSSPDSNPANDKGGHPGTYRSDRPKQLSLSAY